MKSKHDILLLRFADCPKHFVVLIFIEGRLVSSVATLEETVHPGIL